MERQIFITKPYMRGNDVAYIQRKVGVTIDGIYGPVTKAAVQNFQRMNGLVPDGIVGPLTWAKLHASDAPTSPRPAKPGAFIVNGTLSEIEFASHDNNTVMWDNRIPDAWAGLRNAIGKPITVTSGYRTEAHNKAVGGVPGSLHTKGMAIDMLPPAGYTVDTFAPVVAKYFGTAIIERNQGVVHGEVGTNRGVINDGRY